MSRRHIQPQGSEPVPFYNNLLFWAPLTEDGLDNIGNKFGTKTGTVLFSQDGAYLNESFLTYSFTQSEALSAKTFYVEIKPVATLDTYDYMFSFGTVINNGQYYRAAICRKTSGMYLYTTLSYSNNRYDKDVSLNVSFPNNSYTKVAMVFNPTSQVIYKDGTQVWSNSGTDTFTAWSQYNLDLIIGGSPMKLLNRDCRAYIRDFRIYNIALTASEVAQL